MARHPMSSSPSSRSTAARTRRADAKAPIFGTKWGLLRLLAQQKSRQDDRPGDRFGGGLPAGQAALQGSQQRVTRLTGIDEFVESHVLSRAVRRLQLGVAQLDGEILIGM